MRKREIQDMAEHEAQRVLRDNPPGVVEAVYKILGEHVGPTQGRPAEPDDPYLRQMARLLLSGEVTSIRKAAEAVVEAEEIVGQSPKAVIGRLRRKYGENRERLIAEIEREDDPYGGDEVLRAAFAEKVETWDL